MNGPVFGHVLVDYEHDAHNRDKWRSLSTGKSFDNCVLHCLSAVMRVSSFVDCVLMTLNVNDEDDDK